MTTAELQALISTSDPKTAQAIRDQLGQHSSPAPVTAARGGVAALRAARVPGTMTRTEAAYSRRLDFEQRAGLVIAWDYESDRIKLAESIEGGRGKWFKIDFTVLHADGHTSYDEIKGGWATPAGIERFRWLCDRYPRRHWRLWRFAGGTWTLKHEAGGAK